TTPGFEQSILSQAEFILRYDTAREVLLHGYGIFFRSRGSVPEQFLFCCDCLQIMTDARQLARHIRLHLVKEQPIYFASRTLLQHRPISFAVIDYAPGVSATGANFRRDDVIGSTRRTSAFSAAHT